MGIGKHLRSAARLLLTICCLAAAAPSSYGKSDELARSGYKASLPLSEAIREFNSRAQQDDVGKGQMPLKLDEVVASIRAWNLQDEPIDKSAYQAFQRIAATSVMPKGSYIRYISEIVNRNGFDIKVWWIDVQIDLDKYPTDLADVPMYVHRVRSEFVSSERHVSSAK